MELLLLLFGGDDERTKKIEAAENNEELTVQYLNVETGLMSNLKIKNTKNLITGKDVNFAFHKDAFYLTNIEIDDLWENLNISVNPNPITNQTIIEFVLTKSTNININIYSTSGKLFDNIYNGVLSKGSHSINYNSSKIQTGEYNLIFEWEGIKYIKKVIIAK